MLQLPHKINVLSEMERLCVKYEFAGHDSIKCLCPFHDDTSPSCSINTDTGLYKCFACNASGDFIAFFSRVVDRPRQVVFADLLQRYDLGTEKSVDPQIIEAWHSRIWSAGPLLKALRDRGVTDDMLRQYRIGEYDGRITIPVADAGGRVINVRRYLPGAPAAEKFKNMKGRGKPSRLFPIDQLRFDDIVLCGGEIKAVVAAGQLNKHAIGAIATTGGEADWSNDFTLALANKRVWLCYDIDATGTKEANVVASKLYGQTSWVGVAVLPLDPVKYPKGDINDFIGQENGDLHAVLLDAAEWTPPKIVRLVDEPPQRVNLSQAYSYEFTEKRISVEAVISAMADVTYVVPQVIDIKCDKTHEACARCPVFAMQTTEYEISKEDPVILEFVEESKKSQHFALMRSLSIPLDCNIVTFDVLKYTQADDVRVSPKLDILSRDTERALQRVLCVRDGLALNQNYALTGRQYPHPRDQSATLLISSYEAMGDALSNFKLDSHEILNKFKPDAWTVDSIAAKLDEVYADLEYNVTYIIQRRDMHLAMDLSWHSPLFITFDERVEKGHTEILIVGDSSQGKSEASKRLKDHYGVSTKVECKNATVAGLLGGLQKLNGRWFVSWGIIPTNDKMHVILEEVKGASTEVISKMTDMRSSGVAEIPKIEKRRAAARTRLLWISNPRSERPVSAYSFGVEIIKELIGALEDIRRFDMCMIVARDEIDAEEINKPRSQWKKIDHVFDAVSCRSLILWSWTRLESQAIFSKEAETATLKAASALCKLFCSEIPIVDTASMRYKIARLAASLAARTFSTLDDDPDTLLVRPCHVEYIEAFLTRVYSSKSFGYIDYTKSVRESSTMSDYKVVESAIRNITYARDLAESMLRAPRFDTQDVQDWCGLDRIEASALISLLVRKRAVTRDGRAYVKTPGMVDTLKRLIESGISGIPSHLKTEEF